MILIYRLGLRIVTKPLKSYIYKDYWGFGSERYTEKDCSGGAKIVKASALFFRILSNFLKRV